jgi:hypothetical protein
MQSTSVTAKASYLQSITTYLTDKREYQPTLRYVPFKKKDTCVSSSIHAGFFEVRLAL